MPIVAFGGLSRIAKGHHWLVKADVDSYYKEILIIYHHAVKSISKDMEASAV